MCVVCLKTCDFSYFYSISTLIYSNHHVACEVEVTWKLDARHTTRVEGWDNISESSEEPPGSFLRYCIQWQKNP